jgi:hypothetical protein
LLDRRRPRPRVGRIVGSDGSSARYTSEQIRAARPDTRSRPEDSAGSVRVARVRSRYSPIPNRWRLAVEGHLVIAWKLTNASTTACHSCGPQGHVVFAQTARPRELVRNPKARCCRFRRSACVRTCRRQKNWWLATRPRADLRLPVMPRLATRCSVERPPSWGPEMARRMPLDVDAIWLQLLRRAVRSRWRQRRGARSGARGGVL